jgi:hypothetical protein
MTNLKGHCIRLLQESYAEHKFAAVFLWNGSGQTNASAEALTWQSLGPFEQETWRHLQLLVLSS